MRKTTKSLASLLLVMAMVFTMIPASLFTASAAEHVLSFYAIDGSGDFTFTNVEDGKTFGNNLLRAGFGSGSKGTSNESFSFKAGKQYTFKIVGGVSAWDASSEIANIYINGSKVGDFGKIGSLSYSSVYGCQGFEKTFTYTATADVTAPVVVEFKGDKYNQGYATLTISGEFGAGGQSTDTDPTTDTDTPSSGSETVIWKGSHNVGWSDYKFNEKGDVKFVPGSITDAQAGDKIIFTYTATDNYSSAQFIIKALNWKESYINFSPSNDATTYEIVLTAEQASNLNSAQELIIKGQGFTVTKIVYESQNASVKYTVTANASPVAGGTVTGGGTYEEGSSVTVTATPNSGYVFKAWNNGTSDVSTDASYTFTASANVTLTASFVKVIKEYTVTIGSTNGGTATVNGEATATVEEGTTVELKATPAEGYQFVGWLVDNTNISAANPYTYTVNGDVTVTPVFEKIKSSVTVTVTPDGAGTVTGAGDYESGSTATLKATPKAGYEFSGWIIDGETVATTSTANITVGTSDINVTAKFVPKSITVTVIASPTEGGTVTGAGNYDYGTKATLVATPNEGYRFVGWYVDGYCKSTDATFSYAVPTDNVKVTASFEEIVYYTVTTTTNNANYGSVTAGNTYEAGTQITLKATPASDAYKFVGWYDGDTKVSDNASYTFDVKEDVTLEARFAEIVKYTVTVEAGANGKVSGGGTFEEGTQVTVKATANTGYAFKGWYVDGSCKSADASYTFVVDSNITLTATFEEATTTDTIRLEGENATRKGDVTVAIPNENVTVDSTSEGLVALFGKGSDERIASFDVEIPVDGKYTFTFRAVGLGSESRKMQFFIDDDYKNESVSNSGWTDFVYEVELTAGTHTIGAKTVNWGGDDYWRWEWLYFDYVEIKASEPVFEYVAPSYTVNATVDGNGTVAVTPDQDTFEQGSTVTVTVTPDANYAVAYWTVNGEQIASTANTYTIDSIDKNYTISAKLVTAYSVITQIKAADKEHPYAFAEIELPETRYPELYDEANWKNGFDLVCSYYLTNYTFKGEAEAIFAVKTSSGKYYYQQATHNLANQSITISNCWYDPDDEVVSVILLVTNFCPEMYKDGEIFKEHGDLMINLNMTFTVYELITRDTPYVDLSNKTDNYIIYGNEIPVLDADKPSDWQNNNGDSWVTFETVIDDLNEFEHRVWEIEYEFDRSNQDEDDGGTTGGVYAGRYYIVPDGDVHVDATGGSGFSFYYRTEVSNTEGIWITLQSNLFSTHEADDEGREPMKVYLEPTGGEWEACFVAYDLSRADGEYITYWDFFVDGSNSCVEANGTYTYVDPKVYGDDYITKMSADAGTFWFTELRLEHYSLITVTYRDQFGKLIDRRITNVGTIQDPPEHIERTGYTFLYWTLGEDVVGEVWRDADGNIVAPGTKGAKVENDGHFDKPVTEQRLYVAHYEYNGDLYQITVQNGAIINMGTDPITKVDCRYETVLQLKADEKASDFAYWVYADYDLVDGEKTNIKYSILSYKPSFHTSVMGNADYIAVYEEDIAAGKEYVVKPLLAYYTVDKTGNNTRYFLSSEGMKLYTSIFNRADVFDSYHDKLHNKISFLCTIAYDEDIYDPIGWGTIVTNNKLTADTVGGADSVKDGTTSDELVITYENFLSATWYWTNVGAQKATIQKTTWTRTDVWDTILAGGQYLMSYTNLNNGIDRHARTFLIAEVLADGSVHMVFSDEYTTGTISGKPATVNINVTIKVNGTVVETTTEGRVVTDTKSKCYTTGSGEVITTATGFVRATPAVGYTFVGWDTNGDGTADITSNKYDYANLTSDVNLTALFKKADTIYVTATVATANGGRISSSVTNNQITAGESVTIYAVPNSGFTFLGWYVSPNNVGISYIPKEYTSTKASYTFVPTKDCYAYAYFAETGSTAKTYTVTIADAVGGTATVNGATSATATYGEKVTLVATPAAGYTFAYWMINDVNSSTSATLEYAVSNNVTITPVFNAENIVYTDKFTIEAEGYTDAQYNLTGKELVTGTDGDVVYTVVNNNGAGKKDVHVVPFTAPADGKYTFTFYYQRTAKDSNIHFDIFTTSSSNYAKMTIDGVTYYETYWRGTNSSSGEGTDEFDSVAVGEWGEKEFPMTLELSAGETILVGLCDNKGHAYFDKVVVTADAEVFEESVKPTVTIVATNGKVTDGKSEVVTGQYTVGTTLTLYPEQNPGYIFKEWRDGKGNVLSTDVEYTFTVETDTTVEAVFEAYTSVNSLDVTINYLGASEITYNGNKGTSFSIDAPVNGTTYTFTLGEVNNYYEFLGWYVGDECISRSTTLKYVYDAANGSVEIVAKYAFKSVDTMPIISIVTSKQEEQEADPQNSGFNAITDSYVDATVSVLNGGAYSNYTLDGGIAEVKGRGNSTWSSAEKNNLKRPIRIKFDKKDKQNLLNLNTTPNAELRNWVLLANNIDRSMYRNALAFELGNALTNIPFTSNYANVEVYINGVYQGVYLLCEQSEADEARNNIAEPENDSVTEVDAFIELDNVQNHKNNGETPDEPVIEGATYDDGDYYFLADKNGTYSFTTYQDPCFTIKSDIFSLAQYNYIKNTVKAAQNTIYDGTKEQIEKVIDVNSFVDMYILQEIAKNIDVGYSSFYMMLKGGKLYLTNPWDFDKAFGDDDRADSTTGLYVGEKEGADDSRNYNPWFVALLDKTWFKNLVEARWTALYDAGTFTTVAETIKADYNSKAASLARNWTMWKDKMDDKLDNEPSAVLNYSSHKQAFDGLMSWYEARIAYINSKYYNGTGTGGEGGEGGETTDGTVSADGTTLTIEAENYDANHGYEVGNITIKEDATYSNGKYTEITGSHGEPAVKFVAPAAGTYTFRIYYFGGSNTYYNFYNSSDSKLKDGKISDLSSLGYYEFTYDCVADETYYIGLYGNTGTKVDYFQVIASSAVFGDPTDTDN